MATGTEFGLEKLDQQTHSGATTIPLIAEHDSWVTLDPIIGCPADCVYCYLGPLSLRMKRPQVRASPDVLASALADYLFGRRSLIIDPESDTTPLCLGNYTDMTISAGNRRVLVEYLQAFKSVLPRRRPVILVTKGALDPRLVEEVENLAWPVYWAFSQSMAQLLGRGLEHGPVAGFGTTTRNAQLVRTTEHQRSFHFWRPFVRELRLPSNQLAGVLDELQGAGVACSVVLGLKNLQGVAHADRRLAGVIGESVSMMADQHDAFDALGWQELHRAAAKRGFPVYRSTSCAVAYLSGSREQLGTWRGTFAERLCRPSVCPTRQRRRCGLSASDHLESETADRVAEFLQISPSAVKVSGNRRLVIESSVDEYDFNVLNHGLASQWDIEPRAVQREKAWLGVRAERFGE